MPDPYTVDPELAARIDRVEARLSAAVAEGWRSIEPGAVPLVQQVAGGLAVLARPSSPVNKVIGAGFSGAFDADELAAVEAAWEERGEAVRIELASLVAPDAADSLRGRGYRLLGFEHVLVRSLADALPDAPGGIEVRTTDADARWSEIAITGFLSPDGTGAEVDHHDRSALEDVMRDLAAARGFTRYTAWLDGRAVGAASLRIDDGIALLCGATTMPDARRRGVQRALLAARLADARRAGCTLSAVTTAPGSASQHNVQRSGFAVGYVRALLVGSGTSTST